MYSRPLTGPYYTWDIAPAHLRAVAYDLAGRNLSEQERQRYLSWAGPRHATCRNTP